MQTGLRLTITISGNSGSYTHFTVNVCCCLHLYLQQFQSILFNLCRIKQYFLQHICKLQLLVALRGSYFTMLRGGLWRKSVAFTVCYSRRVTVQLNNLDQIWYLFQAVSSNGKTLDYSWTKNPSYSDLARIRTLIITSRLLNFIAWDPTTFVHSSKSLASLLYDILYSSQQ